MAYAPDANDDSDFGQLLPLSGGDVLFIFDDVSADTVKSAVWHAGTTSWDASAVDLDTWVEDANHDAPSAPRCWSTTAPPTSTWQGIRIPPPQHLTGELRSYHYDDATRTWDTPVTIVDDNEGAISEGSMFVDNDTGDIYAVYIRGNLAYNNHVYYRKSTDGGATWSEESSRVNTVADDLKNISGGLGINKMYAVWYNDDKDSVHGNELFSLSASPTPSGPTEVVTNSPAVCDIGVNNVIVSGIVRGAVPEAHVRVYWGETDGL